MKLLLVAAFLLVLNTDVCFSAAVDYAGNENLEGESGGDLHLGVSSSIETEGGKLPEMEITPVPELPISLPTAKLSWTMGPEMAPGKTRSKKINPIPAQKESPEEGQPDLEIDASDKIEEFETTPSMLLSKTLPESNEKFSKRKLSGGKTRIAEKPLNEDYGKFLPNEELKPKKTRIAKTVPLSEGYGQTRVAPPKQPVFEGYGQTRVAPPKQPVFEGYGQTRVAPPKPPVFEGYGQTRVEKTKPVIEGYGKMLINEDLPELEDIPQKTRAAKPHAQHKLSHKDHSNVLQTTEDEDMTNDNPLHESGYGQE